MYSLHGLLPGLFLLSVFVPCTRLIWLSPQLLSAYKYTVSYHMNGLSLSDISLTCVKLPHCESDEQEVSLKRS